MEAGHQNVAPGSSNYGHLHEAVGKAVTYVDPVGVHHDALVTAVWGTGAEAFGQMAINVVYVDPDPNKHDPYGRQIAERATSVQAAGPTAAHGRYYIVPESAPVRRRAPRPSREREAAAAE